MHESAFYMQKLFDLHPECTRVHFTCKSNAQMHPICIQIDKIHFCKGSVNIIQKSGLIVSIISYQDQLVA